MDGQRSARLPSSDSSSLLESPSLVMVTGASSWPRVGCASIIQPKGGTPRGGPASPSDASSSSSYVGGAGGYSLADYDDFRAEARRRFPALAAGLSDACRPVLGDAADRARAQPVRISGSMGFVRWNDV